MGLFSKILDLLLKRPPKGYMECPDCDGTGCGWDFEVDCERCESKGYVKEISSN